MVDLTDSTGEQIVSTDGYWYKIVLADGKELGFGEPWYSHLPNGRSTLKFVHAGHGMVFRYQRADGSDRAHQGWPIGDTGYLRGLHIQADGTPRTFNLSLSAAPVTLCGFTDNDNYGFVAQQLPNNRVSLYAYREKTICGLRVSYDNHIIPHEGDHLIGLDCAFVKVSTRFSTGLF